MSQQNTQSSNNGGQPEKQMTSMNPFPFASENLSISDVYSILKQRGFNIDSEKSISEPTFEFFHNVLTFCTSLLLKIPLDEVTASSQGDLLGECDVDGGLKAMQCIQKMKYIRQMLELIGIDDVGSCDLIKPDKKKVKRVLIGISQYILYQETTIRNHIEILEKNVFTYDCLCIYLSQNQQRVEDIKLKKFGEELENLRFESDQLKERKEAEKGIFKEKIQLLEKLGIDYNEMLIQKEIMTKEKVEQKERRIQIENAILKADEDIKRTEDMNQKERQKIVKSPFKLKDSCQQLVTEINNAQNELQIIKSEIQFLNIKKELRQILLFKLKKHLQKPSLQIQESISLDLESTKNLKVQKNLLKELTMKEEKINENLQTIQNTTQEVNEEIDAKFKIVSERKKQYENDKQNNTQELNKLKSEVDKIQQTINEINAMKKNLDSNAIEQESIHSNYIKQQKKYMLDILNGVHQYKKNIFLMLNEPQFIDQ